MPFGLLEALAVLAVATIGAAVNATAGFGLAMVAAAPLLLVHGPFIPGPLMAASLVLKVLVVRRDRSHIDFAGLPMALVGRAIGTIAAAGFLVVASESLFDIAFAGMVLVAIGLSLAGFHLRPNRLTAVLAGTLSGLMGTISSIGGPPMALLYQSSGAARLRGTLAGFATVGSIMTIVAVAAVGRFGVHEILLSVFLVPAMVLGFWISNPLQGLLKDGAVRPLVLGLSSIAAILVLWRALG